MGGEEAPLKAAPPPPEPPPPASSWLKGWRPVHFSVAAATVLIVLGVVIAHIDAFEWRHNHVHESEYETFIFPCQVRMPVVAQRLRSRRAQSGAACE